MMKKVQIGHFGDLPTGQIVQQYFELRVGSLWPGPSKPFLKNEGGITDLFPG